MQYFRVVIPAFLLIFALIYFLFFREVHHSKFAHKITIQTGQKLRDEKELYLIGTGGQMMDDIKMMYMGFQYFKPVNLGNGRDLLVYSIQLYLNEINKNEKVRPYLHEYPFTPKNIEIDIWIRNADGSKVASDRIRHVHIADGILSYHMDGIDEYSRKTVHEETYEEALKASR